jgi:hypothetical protein
MLLPMSSRSVFALAFAVVVVAPFGVIACDALKKDAAADAGAPAVAPVAETAAPATAAAATETAPAAVAPVAPLGAAVTPTPAAGGTATVKPVATDAGGAVVVTDAGAVADAGKAAPAPTPTFQIPTAIPGFDAGAFKPPAGFPSTIPTTFPTIPPPPK